MKSATEHYFTSRRVDWFCSMIDEITSCNGKWQSQLLIAKKKKNPPKQPENAENDILINVNITELSIWFIYLWVFDNHCGSGRC